jgi:hypothetical protein
MPEYKLIQKKKKKKSHDALVELLEPMKDFFERLGVYTQIPLTAEMAEVLVKIVAEIFSILSIATKEVKRKRASESSLQDILHTEPTYEFDQKFISGAC